MYIMDGMTASKVQKITFLIFKSLTLRQKYGIKLRFNAVFFIFEVIFRTYFGVKIYVYQIDPYFDPYRAIVERINRSIRSALSRRIRSVTCP